MRNAHVIHKLDVSSASKRDHRSAVAGRKLPNTSRTGSVDRPTDAYSARVAVVSGRPEPGRLTVRLGHCLTVCCIAARYPPSVAQRQRQIAAVQLAPFWFSALTFRNVHVCSRSVFQTVVTFDSSVKHLPSAPAECIVGKWEMILQRCRVPQLLAVRPQTLAWRFI